MSEFSCAQFSPPVRPCNLPLARCPVARQNASHRFLIVLLGAYGDIVMGTPLIAALRQAYPEAHFTWMVERKHRQAIDANPFLDELLIWESDGWKRLLRRGRFDRWLARTLELCWGMRSRRFDVLISFYPERWAQVTRAAGAGVSIGVFDAHPRSVPPEHHHVPLYTTAFKKADLPLHRTDIFLTPLRALGLTVTADKRMSLGYTVEDDEQVVRFLAEQGLSGVAPLVVVAPQTTWPSKCWPVEHYIRFGEGLARRRGCHLVLVGSADERSAVETIRDAIRPHPITATGILSFRELAALIARSALVVSGDTAPMHMAAAVGTPHLALFGPTSPQRLAPLSGSGLTLSHAVPCGPCYRKECPLAEGEQLQCLRLISVAEALRAAEILLQGAIPNTSR